MTFILNQAATLSLPQYTHTRTHIHTHTQLNKVTPAKTVLLLSYRQYSMYWSLLTLYTHSYLLVTIITIITRYRSMSSLLVTIIIGVIGHFYPVIFSKR